MCVTTQDVVGILISQRSNPLCLRLLPSWRTPTEGEHYRPHRHAFNSLKHFDSKFNDCSYM